MDQPTASPSPDVNLARLGLQLPAPAKPLASYIPAVRTGNLLFISGQVPLLDGSPTVIGKVGGAVDIAAAQEAARVCVLNALAIARYELGDLTRVRRVVRAVGHVACAEGFTDVHVVTNGASDLLVEILGPDVGRHSRLALGASELPLGVPFELDLILEVD